MLPKYGLYINVETQEMEIHERSCLQKDKLLEKGKIIKRNSLGIGSNKQEVYKKYKNAFPIQVINLPDCCK